MNRFVDRYFIKKPRLREAVTRVIYGSKDAVVTLLGAELYINTTKENGYFRASLASKRYSVFRDEVAVIQNLASLMRANITFVDIGANVGIYSSTFARLSSIHEGMRVVAFEVDPDTFERLSQNASKHGFEAKNVGLGSERVEGREFVRGAVSHVTTRTESFNKYSVRGRTFKADIHPLSSFDFGDTELILKIDVEGQELDVIRGAKDLLDERRVSAIYLDGADEMSTIIEMLRAYEFTFFDGRTLEPITKGEFSVLAVRRRS